MKRMFIALSLEAPWPEVFPEGRLLEPEARHLTLLFLGEQDEAKILSLLDDLPPFPLSVGPAGVFDECLLLAHVVGCHCRMENEEAIGKYAESLEAFFKDHGVVFPHKNRWLAHVTIARAPYDGKAWMEQFTPYPFITTRLDLFESVGNLHYQSLWQKRLTPSFEKLPHTADIAFIVRGENFRELYENARIALAFEFTPMAVYKADETNLESLVDVVRALNQLITKADLDGGCPFKAVSYHGDANKKDRYLEWEMIVDV